MSGDETHSLVERAAYKHGHILGAWQPYHGPNGGLMSGCLHHDCAGFVLEQGSRLGGSALHRRCPVPDEDAAGLHGAPRPYGKTVLVKEVVAALRAFEAAVLAAPENDVARWEAFKLARERIEACLERAYEHGIMTAG